MRVLVEGIARVRISEFVADAPHFIVNVETIVDDETRDSEIDALMRTLVTQFEEVCKTVQADRTGGSG